MLPDKYQWVLAEFEPDGDPWLLDGIARDLCDAGNPEGAAAVYDRAFGIAPEIAEVRRRRQEVLGRLAVVEHGLRFRYVPAGPFVMGREGEDDERPRHPVWLKPFWLAETPTSWAESCRLVDWAEPPASDCAEVVTVTFRMSRGSASWREANWGPHLAPNIGFRLCRVEVKQKD